LAPLFDGKNVGVFGVTRRLRRRMENFESTVGPIDDFPTLGIAVLRIAINARGSIPVGRRAEFSAEP